MDDPLTPSPYKTLNVPKDATLTTIRSAHRKLVLSCHPDKVQDESAKKIKAEQFHLVQQAYEILADENRRQRYDERVKLATLRAEMMEERGPPRKAQDYGSPRAGQSPIFEMRGGRMYEERVPKHARMYEEDVFNTKFAESRPSSKKYDDRYAESPRRSSGRAQEEKRRARDQERELDAERERRIREDRRAAEVAARRQGDRRRDKDRKRDTETKSSRKFAFVDDDASDSEPNDRYYSSKGEGKSKPKSDVRRGSREERLRRSSKREVKEYDEDLDYKTLLAQEHINKSREAVEIEPRPRPSRAKTSSNLDHRPAPSSPHPIDGGRRSSGDQERRNSGRGRTSRAVSPVRKSGRDKRVADIVDPTSNRKPSMPAASSDPRGLKSTFTSSSRREPQRSATYQSQSDFKHPGMRRSETMPTIPQMRREPVPLKSSNLKESKPAQDSSSDDSSDSEETDATPEVYTRHSPRQKSTRYEYKIRADEGGSVVAEPEEYITRDVSPKNRRSSDRPPMAPRTSANTNVRTPPIPRSMSYAFPPEDRPSPRQSYSRTESARAPPPIKTHHSSRGPGQLFGEYSPNEDYSPKTSHASPKVYDDVRHGKSYSRRGSADVDPDSYPGSHYKSHRRPQMGRGESVY